MKAIHNELVVQISKILTVVNKAKIQNESNSQLPTFFYCQYFDCCQQSKDTKWKQFTTGFDRTFLLGVLLSTKQRYKMKAIHNIRMNVADTLFTVVNKAKIQNESNSQQQIIYQQNQVDCCQQSKDTKWKQFTTQQMYLIELAKLLSTKQRYKMKAIHNCRWEFM